MAGRVLLDLLRRALAHQITACLAALRPQFDYPVGRGDHVGVLRGQGFGRLVDGTLAGGAMHAVAYGIIFRTLGRALTTTLATRGELHPRQTAKLFEETLGEDLDTSARGLARLVVERARKDR